MNMRTKRINVITPAYDGAVPFPEAASYPTYVAEELAKRCEAEAECSIGMSTRVHLYGFGAEESTLVDEITGLVKVDLWDEFCSDGYKEFSPVSA